MAMMTGPAGIGLIKRNEGCVLRAYLDRLARRPVWTIGYGETGDYVYQGLVWTQQQAEDGLYRRLAREFEPALNEAIGSAPTTQHQFDAMLSLAWNIGVGRIDDPETPEDEGRGFRDSSVLRYHRAGDYQRAADAFRLWNRSGGFVREGLVRRREEERQLYLGETIATVADIQARLIELGYPLIIDNRAGPRTCAAALRALATARNATGDKGTTRRATPATRREPAPQSNPRRE